MHACIGEGSGSPLQYSCLENPKDGGAWWASVYGAAQSQTQLKRLSSSSSTTTTLNICSINSKLLKSQFGSETYPEHSLCRALWETKIQASPTSQVWVVSTKISDSWTHNPTWGTNKPIMILSEVCWQWSLMLISLPTQLPLVFFLPSTFFL